MNTSFSKLKVKGFRRLRDAQVPLGGLNVLIGANGVGKTSVLEVLRLLAASANGRLQETISAASGAGSIITHGQDSMTISLEMPVPDKAQISYDLQLVKNGQAYSIGTESLRQFRNSTEPTTYIDSHGQDIRYYEKDQSELLRPTWPHQPHETSLAQVPKMFQVPEGFRQVLGSSTLYHVLDVSPRAPVRSPAHAADLIARR